MYSASFLAAYTITNYSYRVDAADINLTYLADNVVKTMQKYGENVCLVRHHNENYNRFGARVQLKIEGV